MSEKFNNGFNDDLENGYQENNVSDEKEKEEKAVSQESEMNFVMQEGETKQPREDREEATDVSSEEAAAKEPGEAPTPENPIYARSYKGEEKKEEWYEREQKANYGSYQFTSPVPPEKQKKEKRNRSERKPGGMGRKLGTTAAIAAVFGLVAGVVFQATNYVGEQMSPREKVAIQNTQTVDDTSDSAKSDTVNTNTAASTDMNSVSQVAQNAMPSIVSIVGVSVQEIPQIYQYFGYGQEQETQSSGSGIIVGQNDEELLIATNNHVVSGADSLTVCFTNQDGTAVTSSQDLEKTSTDGEENNAEDASGSAVAAQVKGTDADNDLAVISVKIEDIPEDILNEIKVATIGDSDSLHMGDQVVAIGNALGYGQSLTSGYVSALNRQVSSDNANSTFIQTDAAINPGNSGGALLNMNGELVGINSAKIASNEVEGVGFAIPISRAEPILDELMSKETRYKVEDENKAAYIGITCLDVTNEANQMYGMPLGVYVDSLTEGGPAEEAGIRKGDVILKIDGTSVSTKEELVDRLGYYEAGEEIEFVISRSEKGEYKESTVTVTLGAKKDAPETNRNR